MYKCYDCRSGIMFDNYTCNICYYDFCNDCITTCTYCDETICQHCQEQCFDQRCFSICENCMITCHLCKRRMCKVCIDEDDNRCLGMCESMLCNNCLVKCDECGSKRLCKYDIITCQYCDKNNCNKCYEKCRITYLLHKTYLTSDISTIISNFIYSLNEKKVSYGSLYNMTKRRKYL